MDCSDWIDKDGDDQAEKCTVLNEGEANQEERGCRKCGNDERLRHLL